MLKIQINLSHSLDDIVRVAQMAGYQRENERKAWTEKDKIQAARWFAERCVAHVMKTEYGK